MVYEIYVRCAYSLQSRRSDCHLESSWNHFLTRPYALSVSKMAGKHWFHRWYRKIRLLEGYCAFSEEGFKNFAFFLILYVYHLLFFSLHIYIFLLFYIITPEKFFGESNKLYWIWIRALKRLTTFKKIFVAELKLSSLKKWNLINNRPWHPPRISTPGSYKTVHRILTVFPE